MGLIVSTTKLLEDAIFYLKKIDNLTYSKQLPLLMNSSIGKHTRHFIELYQCLLWRNEQDIVNYEKRPRDKEIETNVNLALQAIYQIQNQLSHVDLQQDLFVQSSLSHSTKVASNMERELMYNYEHCLHHLALIRIGLGLIQPEVTLPSHFGIAPATLAHMESSSQKITL